VSEQPRPRILVVEDDPDASEMIRQMLDLSGFECSAVGTGEKALEAVKGSCPDAIVLDLMLPGIDGFAVCERLKMQRETNLVPVLMLTALDRSEDMLKGVRVGANYYMTKPFKGEELVERLRELLRWKGEMADKGVQGTVTFDVESDLRYLDDVNKMLTSLFEHTKIPDRDVHRIKYAVLEMGHNAIEWGNRNRRKCRIRLSYMVDSEKLTFVVEDQGEGFDPNNVPHAAKPDDPLAHLSLREKLGIRTGGFGILLSKAFMDEVRYNERGNTVTLVKYLSRLGASEEAPPAPAGVG